MASESERESLWRLMNAVRDLVPREAACYELFMSRWQSLACWLRFCHPSSISVIRGELYGLLYQILDGLDEEWALRILMVLPGHAVVIQALPAGELTEIEELAVAA
jgi:hypothetical protein